MKIAVIHSQLECLRPLMCTLQTIAQVGQVVTGTDEEALETVLLEGDLDLLITEYSDPYIKSLESVNRGKGLTVIFYTSLEAIQETSTSDWLGKVVTCEFLFQEMSQIWQYMWIKKLITNLVAGQERRRLSKVMVSDQASLRFLDLDEICYLEKVEGQIVLHTPSQHYFLSSTLEELQGRLPGLFYRSHRSYLVNTSKIESIHTTRRRVYKIKFTGTDKQALLSYQRKANLIKKWA